MSLSLAMPMPHAADARTTLISYNHHAGARDPRKRNRVEELYGALVDLGMHASVVVDRDELTCRVVEEHRQGTLRCVVAAGGDGTVADLVNRLPSEVPIALLPLGTENLLARYLDLPSAPGKLAETVATGKIMALDAGMANGRVFLLMAGCGFDGEVVRRAHTARSGHITRWSYAKPILDAVRTYEYPEFTVQCRSTNGNQRAVIEHSFKARWLFVSNLPRYAGGLCFSASASGQDSLLDVCAFQGRSAWAGVRYWIAVLARRHELMHDCVTTKATQIVVHAEQPVPYQLDGDPGGLLPLTIDVLPGRIQLFVPVGTLGGQFPLYAATEHSPSMK
jgi:diacylglycerol kinase family enzyme